MLQHQKGFSLIELLLVVVILGIITAMAVPFLQQAVGVARNSNAYATLKTISSAQINYFARKNRFARLDELNADLNDSLGINEGTNLRRGVFVLSMSPIVPTDSELRSDFQIIASKSGAVDGTPCVLSIRGSGVITELFGTDCIGNN